MPIAGRGPSSLYSLSFRDAFVRLRAAEDQLRETDIGRREEGHLGLGLGVDFPHFLDVLWANGIRTVFC